MKKIVISEIKIGFPGPIEILFDIEDVPVNFPGGGRPSEPVIQPPAEPEGGECIG